MTPPIRLDFEMRKNQCSDETDANIYADFEVVVHRRGHDPALR